MTTAVYRLRVSLRRINPPIWRQIEIAADTELGKLRRILQIVMGWSDSHLHALYGLGLTCRTPLRTVRA